MKMKRDLRGFLVTAVLLEYCCTYLTMVNLLLPMLLTAVQGTCSIKKLSHEKDLKNTGRYIKAARDRGLIMRPSVQSNIETCPDAEFDRLYGFGEVTDLAYTNSRTKFSNNCVGLSCAVYLETLLCPQRK